MLRLMTPPRDWTAIHWPDIAKEDAARWIAVLPLAATEQHGPHLPLRTDVLIAEAYLARVRELLPDSIPATFLPIEEIGISTEHTDYPGYADAVGRCRAEDLDGDRRKRGARRHQKTGDGHQPRRQQRGDDHRRAGFARAIRPARGDDGDGRASARRRDCLRRQNCATAFTAARSKRRSCWRAIRNEVRTEAIANFEPSSIAMEKEYRWLSTHRPAPLAWQAQDLHPSGAAGDATQASAEKGELLLDHGARAFCELLAEVDNFDVTKLANGPAKSAN